MHLMLQRGARRECFPHFVLKSCSSRMQLKAPAIPVCQGFCRKGHGKARRKRCERRAHAFLEPSQELHFYDETDQVVETVQVGSWKEEDIEAFLNAKLVIA